ncbi:MAG TPA: MBL fold metallo-hydrolase [Patescibacteria group bacterium]|nr:MBL fold metallo-hydrolase [Patescibacteria group bacterium]
MEIQFYGANCVRLTTKKVSIVVDDLEGKVAKNGDVALFTGPTPDLKADTKLVIDQPGEFEVSDTSIQGVAARAHMDEEGKRSATIFKVIGEDVKVVVTGHIYPELSEAQAEALGLVDVLIIPVGGNGYTLDAVGALTVIKEIEPKLVIPTHYADKAVKYEVPQTSLDDAIKELAMEPKETAPKLKLKGGELLNEATQLVILERQ